MTNTLQSCALEERTRAVATGDYAKEPSFLSGRNKSQRENGQPFPLKSLSNVMYLRGTQCIGVIKSPTA